VVIRLDEKLWRGTKDHPFLILGLCAQLETYLERLQKSSQNLQTFQYNKDAVANSIVQQMTQLVDELTINKPMGLTRYLENGPVNFFPLVAHLICASPGKVFPVTLKEQDYLTNISLLSQIITLARQLQESLKETNHKYAAHQLALIYQTIIALGKPLEHYKPRIEGMFESIKNVTETSTAPQLSQEHQKWLFKITGDIINDIESFKTDIVNRMNPILDFYTQNKN